MSTVKYDFDEIIDRRNTNSVKYGVGKMIYPGLPVDYIPMWIADMDFACPDAILDAMKARLDKRILGYSFIMDPEYYEALAGWMEKRHNWKVDARQSLYSAGVVKVLKVAVEYLTEGDDAVLLNTPAYHPFDDAIKYYKRTPVYSRLIEKDGRYEIDWEDFEEKAKRPEVKLYFLCNPHNPTGRVWTKDELRRIGEICFANDVFVVSDEIHFDFIRPGVEHTVFASLFPNEKRIITCTAPSKTFNLAGNELSNIFFADKALMQKWQSAKALGNPNPLSIEACKAAYLHCADWVDQLNVYLERNFRHFKERIDAELPNVRFTLPESTYLAWVDVRGTGLTKKELTRNLVEAGLQIQYEDEFVDNGDGHIRMNLACPLSVVDRAVDMMVKALGPGSRPHRELPKVGDTMPDAVVDTVERKGVSLASLVGDTPTMLLFLRYSGCTLCQLDMHRLKVGYEQVRSAGGQVAVVLQSDADRLRTEVEKEPFPFSIICDPQKSLYDEFAVWPAVNATELMGPGLMEKVQAAAEAGLVHGAYEGDELQLPAAFVLDKDLRIRWMHYGNGLGDTPSVEKMAEIFREL